MRAGCVEAAARACLEAGLALHAPAASRQAGGRAGGSGAGQAGPRRLPAAGPRPSPTSRRGGAGRRRGPLTSSVTRGCSFPRTWLQGTRCRWCSWPSSSSGRLCGSASPALAWNCSPTLAIFAGPRAPPCPAAAPAPAWPRRRPGPARPSGPASPAAAGRSRDVLGPPGARGGARGGGQAPAGLGEQAPNSVQAPNSWLRAPDGQAGTHRPLPEQAPNPGRPPSRSCPQKKEAQLSRQPSGTGPWPTAPAGSQRTPVALTSGWASADSGSTSSPPQQFPPSGVCMSPKQPQPQSEAGLQGPLSTQWGFRGTPHWQACPCHTCLGARFGLASCSLDPCQLRVVSGPRWLACWALPGLSLLTSWASLCCSDPRYLPGTVPDDRGGREEGCRPGYSFRVGQF